MYLTNSWDSNLKKKNLNGQIVTSYGLADYFLSKLYFDDEKWHTASYLFSLVSCIHHRFSFCFLFLPRTLEKSIEENYVNLFIDSQMCSSF